MTTFRYQVFPIADETCSKVDRSDQLFETDNLSEAEAAASGADCPFGAGILDLQTGEVDLGFGFGVPCPEIGKFGL